MKFNKLFLLTSILILGLFNSFSLENVKIVFSPADKPLPIYSKPDGFTIQSRIYPTKDKLTLTGKFSGTGSDEWTEVSSNGVTGWIKKRYILITGKNAPVTQTEISILIKNFVKSIQQQNAAYISESIGASRGMAFYYSTTGKTYYFNKEQILSDWYFWVNSKYSDGNDINYLLKDINTFFKGKYQSETGDKHSDKIPFELKNFNRTTFTNTKRKIVVGFEKDETLRIVYIAIL